MSAYTNAEDFFERIGKGDRYVVLVPFRWSIGRKQSGFDIEVPKGFRFEVSVPRWAQWAFSPHEPRFLKAAALHDALIDDDWDRVTAGAIFHDALKADGVGRTRRLIMWLAVSIWRWA